MAWVGLTKLAHHVAAVRQVIREHPMHEASGSQALGADPMSILFWGFGRG
jgi:hypothetical protein